MVQAIKMMVQTTANITVRVMQRVQRLFKGVLGFMSVEMRMQKKK